MSLQQLWESTPPAGRPSWSKHIVAQTIVLWEHDGGERRISIGHATYSPDQALAFANAVLEAVARAGQRDDESAPEEPGGGWRQNLAGDPYKMHWRPATRWACGCLVNEAGAHRKGCPDHPEGVRP